MVDVTTGVQVVKAPQYVEESTYGTTPTASPTLLWIGGNATVNPQIDKSAIYPYVVASEDPKLVLPGKELDVLALDFFPQNSTFMKYGITAAGGGAGTIDKSLSILWSQKLSGTENYSILTGARINSLKLKGTVGEALQVSTEIWGKSIAAPAASSGLTTPTFATDPATAFWSWVDGGISPVTLNSVALDVTDIEVNFVRNLERVYVMGGTQVAYLPSKTREVTGTFTAVFEANVDWTTLLALSEYTLAWVLKTATSTLTLSNVSLNKLSSLEIKPENVTYEKFAFRGRSASIT